MSLVHVSKDDFNYVHATLMELLMEQKKWPSGKEFIFWQDRATLNERKLAISLLACKLLKYEKEINKIQCVNILSYMDENKDSIID